MKRENPLEYLLLCGMYNQEFSLSCHFPVLSKLFRFANYILWWSRTITILFCHRTGQCVRPAERDKVFVCVNLTERLFIYPEKWPL